jgi:hypothetical protein
MLLPTRSGFCGSAQIRRMQLPGEIIEAGPLLNED